MCPTARAQLLLAPHLAQLQQEVALVVRSRLRPRNLRPRAVLDLCAMGEVLVRQKVSEAWRELADLLT